MADDPFLAAGRKALSGEDDKSSSASSAADPWLAAGRKALATAPEVKAAEAVSDNPYDIKHAWIQIPALHNFAAGVTQGARDVVKSGLDLGTWVNKRIPALEVLDRINPLIGDAEARKAEFEKQRQQYEASPEGQSYTGMGGRLVGEIGTTLPFAGPVGEATGAAVNLLSHAVPAVGRYTAGIAPWLLRTAAEGGTGGATFGAMTEGSTDKPVGEYVEENALLGAALGPPFSLVAKTAGVAGGAAKSGYNWLRGTGPAKEIDATIAAARARAGGSGGEEPPGGGGGASAPPEPSTPTAGPAAPQSGGAAATPSSSVAAHAPDRAREIAGKVDALDQMSSQQSNLGRGDFHEYVKGNKPTLAEGLGDPELATIQRQLEEDQRFVNRRRTLNENRQDHFDNRAGTAEQLDTLERDIAAWDKEKLGPVWANKKPVDASGLETEIKARLASPEAQVGPVEQALKEVEQRLYNRSTGELHTDPQMLYGARRHISHLLSRAGQKANPAYADDAVMSELIAMRDAIDRTIEPGAQGFKEWVTEHAAKMRDVDRMTLLQGMRQKLIGANGEIQGSRMLTQLKALRNMMARGGANPAHSLNIEDLEMLRDLYKDLLRDANRTLALPVGSNTRQNLNTAATHGFDVFNALAQRGASAVPLGGEALAAFTRQTNARNAAVAKEYWIKRLLEPPTGGGGP